MSDWEIVSDEPQKKQSSQSDWEIMQSDESPKNKESLGLSLLSAIPRIGEDVLKGAFNFMKNIPGYYEGAKSEIPGLIESLKNRPGHLASQAGAGIAEMGQNIFNTPHDLANYASNRLNLLPENINQKIQMGRMPDSSQEINQTFGAPQYAGDLLARGLTRNAINIGGSAKLASALNPMNLTASNIAKNILKAEKENKGFYGKEYKKLFNVASNKGFADLSNVSPLIDINTIKKYSPKKGIVYVEDFLNSPTLENAHNAKSDLLRIQRDLNKLTTMRGAERKQYKAVSDAIDLIQKNMFRDQTGKINKGFMKKYEGLQQGYAKDVVPYKNKAIGQFKRNEISSKELVDRISQGEFRAKKGAAHPAIGLRKKVLPITGGIGAYSIGKWLYDKIGNNNLENE